MVAAQLMLRGYEAINANFSITNMANIDLVCLDEKKHMALIQVKTTTTSEGFPVGMTLAQAKDRSYVEQHVIGPWVFVRMTNDTPDTKFIYYVLSKQQVIELIFQSNDWYLKLPRANGKKLNENSPCILQESWLAGKDFISPRLGGTIGKNPLNNIPSQDAWDNIWHS